jgi:ribonucleoside-diphosphate reductase beta chain
MELTTHPTLPEERVARLLRLAQQNGTWQPGAIDFSPDARDWAALSEKQRDVMLRLCAFFHAGEAAVTSELEPLIDLARRHGTETESQFLNTFVEDERKHTELFRRYLSEVAGTSDDLSTYHTEGYRYIFDTALPAAMQRLRSDGSPEARLRAAITYNMVVEGILAETGFQGFEMILQRHEIMPGLQEGVALLRGDESRHRGYGFITLEALMPVVKNSFAILEETFLDLAPRAFAHIRKFIAPYGPGPYPFEVQEWEILAMVGSRLRRLIGRLPVSSDEGRALLISVLRANSNLRDHGAVT